MVHSGIQFIMFWSLFWGKLSLVLNLKNNFQTDKFPPETSYKKQTKNSFAWKSSQVSLTRISHKLFGVDKFKVILVICYCTSPFTQWQIMDIPATLPSQPTCYSSLRFCFSGRHFQGWFFFLIKILSPKEFAVDFSGHYRWNCQQQHCQQQQWQTNKIWLCVSFL